MPSISKKNWILPIPELVEAEELKTLYFVISDLRTGRLAGIKKKVIRGALKDRGRPMSVLLQAKFYHVGHPAKATGELGSPCATSRLSLMEMSSPTTKRLWWRGRSFACKIGSRNVTREENVIFFGIIIFFLYILENKKNHVA